MANDVRIRELIFHHVITIETVVDEQVVGHEFTRVRERVCPRRVYSGQSQRVTFRCELRYKVDQRLGQTASYRTFNADKRLFFTIRCLLLPRRRRKRHEAVEVNVVERDHCGTFRTITVLTPALRQRLSSTFNVGLG